MATEQQKIAAAQEALAALDPPRTEEDVAPNTLEAVVAVVWSQMALVPAAVAANGAPLALFGQVLRTSNPDLMAEVDALNAEHARLAAKIAADNLANAPTPAPTR